MGHTGQVRARSAVFDLYGDHLAARDYWAPVSAVVALLRSCGIAPAATRTAVSRMVSSGHLRTRARHGLRGYEATPATRERLRRAHDRIYRAHDPPWDGDWHVVVLDHLPERGRRDRVAATLGYLGYGRLAPQTWVAAQRSPELPSALDTAAAGWTDLAASLRGRAPEELAARVWDLPSVAEGYRAFAQGLSATRARLGADVAPERAYVERTELVHAWRAFLFVDPGLPAAAQPPDWPEAGARSAFLDLASALMPAARTFVDETLASAGVPAAGLSGHEQPARPPRRVVPSQEPR